MPVVSSLRIFFAFYHFENEGRLLMNKLFIICGISFARKSALGVAIAQRFGYAQVDVDDTKVQLYGLDCKDEELHHADWVRIYQETDKLMENYLQSGKSVIDASRNFRRQERQLARDLALQARAKIVTIFVDTPEAIARQRLLANRAKSSRRDITDKDFEEILQVWKPPTVDENPLVFCYGDQIETWVAQNISTITCITFTEKAKVFIFCSTPIHTTRDGIDPVCYPRLDVGMHTQAG